MIKNIILTLAIIIAVFFFAYSDKQTLIAKLNLFQAQENLREADRQRQIADTNAIEIEQLRKALEECNQ